MKPKLNIRRGLLSLALTAALIVSAIGVKEFMGQYAPTATPGVRVYASDEGPVTPEAPETPETDAEKLAHIKTLITEANAAIETGCNEATSLEDAKAEQQTAQSKVNESLDIRNSMSDEAGDAYSQASSLITEAQFKIDTNLEEAIAHKQAAADADNFSTAIEKCQIAQNNINGDGTEDNPGAKKILAAETAKENPANRDPNKANSLLTGASDALTNAKNALAKVSTTTLTVDSNDGSPEVTYDRAKVAQLIQETEGIVNEGYLAKDAVYISLAESYIAQVHTLGKAITETINDTKNKTDATAIATAKADCQDKLTAARAAAANAADALKTDNITANGQKQNNYKDAVQDLSVTNTYIDTLENRITLAFAPDDEKVTRAKTLLTQAQAKVTEADTESKKGDKADTSKIGNLLYDAELYVSNAEELLNAVTDETEKNKDAYKAAVSDAAALKKTVSDKIKAYEASIKTPTPETNDQPVAKDAKGNTYLAKDVKVISVRYSAADAKQYIQTARKNSNAKNVDFSRAVVFNVVLMNANGDMLTMLPNHSIYVDLDMTDFKESELKNAVLFHITDGKAEGVRCWTITNDSKKCWIRFAGDSFSPYVVANIGATTSTGSDNPGTGDFSALPIILIGAAALLGIGGVLVYRKKKSDAE